MNTATAPVRKAPASARAASSSPLGAILTVANAPRLGPQPKSLDKALACAQHWVQLSDARRPDAMWLEAGAMMQRMVPRSEWVRYLRKIRLDRGVLVGREWFEMARVRDPVGLPAGDYMNVIFMAHYAKAVIFETVSLAPGTEGWLPVGYVIRPVQRDITYVP